jgi:SAM-dependent methyltransferase
MLTDTSERTEAFLSAAREYPRRISHSHHAWLYMKPFEWTPGHAGYFYNMHNALGLVRAMKICPGGDVLEVGCGPGWLTEMLLMLGYRVTAVEPSGDLIAIAKHRVAHASDHYRMPTIRDQVRFIEGSVEEHEFGSETFDAVIFYDVLHHVMDEELVFEKCARSLRPGGVLGIIEGAWVPGCIEQERALFEEMATYATLENPFTQGYLDALLKQYGFERMQRLIGVSGMFPVADGEKKISELALENPDVRNDLIAWKPGGLHRFSNDAEANTAVDLVVLKTSKVDKRIMIELEVTNTGNTVLIGGELRSGAINFGLRAGDFASGLLIEGGRFLLPSNVNPGAKLAFTAEYGEPQEPGPWYLDVAIEHIAWLSQKGKHPVCIRF